MAGLSRCIVFFIVVKTLQKPPDSSQKYAETLRKSRECGGVFGAQRPRPLQTSVSYADANITELCSTSLSPQKYQKVCLFLRPILRKSRLFWRPKSDQFHGGQGLLWGFYTFCEPSVRPHFIPSTKQARRTRESQTQISMQGFFWSLKGGLFLRHETRPPDLNVGR